MTILSSLKIGLLGAALFLASPAFAGDQTSGPAAGTKVEPSKGLESGGMPGEPGLPGNKSGRTVKPGENATTEKMKTQRAKKDTIGGAPGVPGMRGNKSGPAVTRPK